MGRSEEKASGKIGDSQATSDLITALKDSDIYVRKAAVEALGKIGDSQATSDLITALKDSDSEVRKAAVEALGKIGNLETLQQILENPNLDIYDYHIFPLLRKLAMRHSKAKVDFIPVYPETVELYGRTIKGKGEEVKSKVKVNNEFVRFLSQS